MVAESIGTNSAHMWHVTLTVSGAHLGEIQTRAALERLSHEHPFLLSGRFADDRAEVRYWDEAEDISEAVAIALKLWTDHLVSARLPPWQAVGVEVVSQDTFHRRAWVHNKRPRPLSGGRLLPF